MSGQPCLAKFSIASHMYILVNISSSFLLSNVSTHTDTTSLCLAINRSFVSVETVSISQCDISFTGQRVFVRIGAWTNLLSFLCSDVGEVTFCVLFSCAHVMRH